MGHSNRKKAEGGRGEIARQGGRQKNLSNPHSNPMPYEKWRDSKVAGLDREYAEWREYQRWCFDENYRQGSWSPEMDGRKAFGNWRPAPARSDKPASGRRK